MKTVVYESLSEFLAAAEADPSPHKTSHREASSSFFGGTSFAEAARLARVGWPEGAARVSSIAAEITADIGGDVSRPMPSLSYDVTGEWVDVGRVVTGDPECCGAAFFWDASPATKIVVNVSANASVSPESMITAGGAVASAIDAHESAGRRCEIWIASGSQRFGDGETLQVFVLVKAADQPLDIDRLAFLVAHPATLRRLMFSVEHDLGFAPGGCKTAPIEIEDGIETPEVTSGFDARKFAREIRQRLGVRLDVEEGGLR